MMGELWLEELSKFLKLSQLQKIAWLSRLLFFISMFARDTYQVGTNQVDKPDELRRYNELLHRISSYLMELVSNDPEATLGDQFFLTLTSAVEELDINVLSLLSEIRKSE